MILRVWGERSKQVLQLKCSTSHITVYEALPFQLSALCDSLCAHIIEEYNNVLPSFPKGSRDFQNPIYIFSTRFLFLCQLLLSCSTVCPGTDTHQYLHVFNIVILAEKSNCTLKMYHLPLLALHLIFCREKQWVIFRLHSWTLTRIIIDHTLPPCTTLPPH